MSSPKVNADGGSGRGRPAIPLLREERRSAIVCSAYAVLAERGYAGTAMSDIARHAGVGKGTLYRYFASKRELLDEVFDYAVLKAARALDIGELVTRQDRNGDSSVAALITAVGQRLFALADRDPAVLRFLAVESSAIDLELRNRVIGLFTATEAELASFVARCGPDPGPDRAVLTMLSRLMVGSNAPGLMMTLGKDDSEKKRSDFLTTIESVAAHGLFRLSAATE